MTRISRATLAAGAIAAALAANGSSAAVLRVGPSERIATIAEAAALAADGDEIEIAAGVYADGAASWRQSELVIRAVGGRARVLQGAAAAEGKAIWVVHGDNVRIEHIEFAGARVADRNAAGIRHEGGRLTVRDCLFEHNEMGLLTWNDARSELTIEASEFRANAVAATRHRGDPLGHELYVGSIARFTLVDSFVHAGAFGHLVKSRARVNIVAYNRLVDGAGGRASYELEFPNGGAAYVIGNVIAQSAATENEDLVSFGAEGYRYPDNALELVHNTLVDATPGGRFVHVHSEGARTRIVDNLLVGRGRLGAPAHAQLGGNARVQSGALASIATGDFRLRRGVELRVRLVDPGTAGGVDLRPAREPNAPLASRPLDRGLAIPGALQTRAP